MATFTLSGNIDQLSGGDSTRARTLVIQSTRPLVGAGDVTYEYETIQNVGPGAWAMTLPVDVGALDYAFIITCPQVKMRWVVPAQAAATAVDLAEFPDSGDPWVPQRSAIDHGDVSGAIELSASYSLHEINLTGPTTITPTAPKPGADMVVRVTGAGTLTLVGVEWDTAEVEVPGVFILTWWASAGWRAASVSPVELTEVTPAAPTFNDVGNVLTIPGTTGVQYKQDGVNIAAGTYNDQDAGLTTITAHEKTGYEFPLGATVSWPHTYPGWTVVGADPFTAADGTALNGRTSPTGSRTWSTSGSLPGVTITSNKVQLTSGTDVTGSLSVPGTPTGIRLQSTYNSGGGSLTARSGLGSRYVSTAFGSTQNWGVNVGPAGQLETYCRAGDSITLSGTTTGHPTSGVLTVECDGTAIKVSIDGVEVATATLPGTLSPTVGLFQLVNNAASVDDFQVETK